MFIRRYYFVGITKRCARLHAKCWCKNHFGTTMEFILRYFGFSVCTHCRWWIHDSRSNDHAWRSWFKRHRYIGWKQQRRRFVKTTSISFSVRFSISYTIANDIKIETNYDYDSKYNEGHVLQRNDNKTKPNKYMKKKIHIDTHAERGRKKRKRERERKKNGKREIHCKKIP